MLEAADLLEAITLLGVKNLIWSSTYIVTLSPLNLIEESVEVGKNGGRKFGQADAPARTLFLFLHLSTEQMFLMEDSVSI